MLRALVNRLGWSALVLFGVSILIFSIARILPGDPARIALGADASQEQVDQLRAALHLDEPLPVQYWFFLRDLSNGDLGVSLYSNRPVLEDLASLFPATLELVLVSGGVMAILGIGLGILAARYRNTWIDSLVSLVSLGGIVTPSFVWAVMLMLVFAYWFDLFPIAGRLSPESTPPPFVTGMYTFDALIAGQWAVFKDALRHLVLPATALAMASVSQTARLVRASLVDTYSAAHVEMARAYGYSEAVIASKYALRPAMVAALTVMGLDFAAKLGGAFLIETVYAWPGMARYGVNVILYKDLNSIVGVVLVISAFFLVVNMLVDFAISTIDPRIRLQS